MQARAPLMIEHRLIEKMISVVKDSVLGMKHSGSVDSLFIDKVVDFIRTYADRTHHGKEEDILFRKLEERSLSNFDRKIMEELVEEHQHGRKTTRALIEATSRYRKGQNEALKEIVARLEDLAEFYPIHIQKEDKVFFPAARAYFTEDEDQAMLREFREFDRNMIHEKYKSIVEDIKESK